ncbi:MAG: peptide ABC transporter substrate-binding protein [Candidatus Dormibacteria bacterium]
MLALDADPVSLNPLVAGDVSSVRAYAPLFPNLYSVDAHQVVAPDLAAGFPEVSKDGLTWTVRLRSGARWSDLKPITAADVVYTVKTEANPALDTRATFDWSNLAGVERVDDTSLRFTLKAADAAFLADRLVMPVVPEHVLSATDVTRMSQSIYGSSPSVTGGPFKFVRRAQGVGIELAASPTYYGGRPILDRLREVVVRDPLGAADALANAQLTWQQGLTGAAAARVRGTVGVRVASYPDLGYHDLRFNTRPGHPFADLAARQAVAYSIDRERLVTAATAGNGVTLWGDISPTSWAYDESATVRYRKDVPRARALLNGAHFKVTVDYARGDHRVAAAADQVSNALVALGLTASSRELTPSGLRDELARGDFDLAISSRGLGLDPDESDVLQPPAAASTAASAYSGTGYASPELDSLLARERALQIGSYAETMAMRKVIFSDIQRHLGTNLPVIYLWADTRYQGINTTMEGLDDAGNQADQDRNSRLYAGLFLRS